MNAKEENTPEKVWVYLMKVSEKLEKVSEKLEKVGEKLEKTDQIVNGIAKSNGDVAEDTIYNALEKDMTFAGIEFDFIDRNWNRHSKKLNLKGEYDVILENGDTMALIETKYKVRKDDVSKFVTNETENKFRKLFPNYNNYKLLLGIGGMSFEKDALEEAKENGIGIIKVIGDKVEYYTEGIKTY